MKIIKTILDNLNKNADKNAFVYFENEKEKFLNCSEFHNRILYYYKKISELKIMPESRIMLVGENSPDWPACFLASHMLGLTVIHGDINFTENEFTNIQKFSEPSLIICDEKFSKFLCEQIPKILITQDFIKIEKFEPEIVQLKADQPMSIIFTSGTTGEPKGVMLSEENFLSNLTVFAQEKNIINKHDRVVSILPLHHVYPFTCTVLAPLYFNASIIYPKSLKGEDIFGAINQFKGTILIAIPKVLELFAEKIFVKVNQSSSLKKAIFYTLYNLSKFLLFFKINISKLIFRKIHCKMKSLRYFSCGGAKFNLNVHHQLKILGFKILEAYGLTETAPIASINSFSSSVTGSIGKPAYGVKIKTEKMDKTAYHGEICIKGPNVMMGYYKRPDFTDAVIKQGWFHSGDLGFIDKKGYVYITGRKKEVIILANGKNVYPDEVEKVYSESKKIKEICICHLVHENRESLAAFIFPDQNYFLNNPSTNLYQDIKWDIETISQKLPSFKRVSDIFLTNEEFPKTSLGKIKRYLVAEKLKSFQKNKTLTSNNKKAESDPFILFIKKILSTDVMLSYDSNFDTDLGLDSLTKLELLGAVEKKYNIKITEEEAIKILTISDLKALVPAVAENGDNDSDILEETILTLPEVSLDKVVSIKNNVFASLNRLIFHYLFKIFFKLFFKVKVTGLENIKNIQGPFIIAPNHNSLIDAPLMYGVLPFKILNQCYFMSLPQYFAKFPGSMLRKIGRILLTGTRENAFTSLQYSYQILQTKKPMCVFLEGTRSLDGKVKDAKKGMGLVAKLTKSKIIPVHIKGNNAILSRTNPGWHKSEIMVQVMHNLNTDGEVDEFLNTWKEVIENSQREE